MIGKSEGELADIAAEQDVGVAVGAEVQFAAVAGQAHQIVGGGNVGVGDHPLPARLVGLALDEDARPAGHVSAGDDAFLARRGRPAARRWRRSDGFSGPLSFGGGGSTGLSGALSFGGGGSTGGGRPCPWSERPRA